MMTLTQAPVVRAELLIRKPPAEVFEAFVNPDVVTRFWFNRSTGRLEEGKTVQWFWDICEKPAEVRVKVVARNKRILMEWGGGEKFTTVEWLFEERRQGTFVTVINSGFHGTGDEVVGEALDSTGGFTLVLAAAKAWLEHGINLNIVADKFPERESGVRREG